MRLAPDLLWLIGLISFLCSSTVPPAAARPLPTHVNKCERLIFDLGGGWTFCFTNSPSLFFPIEPAAARLNNLYQLAKTSAINTAKGVGSASKYSSEISFRVGQFALVFVGNFEDKYDDNWKATISWPAIATFCEKMQEYVRKGEVLYYRGVIDGTGGEIMVQLTLISDPGYGGKLV